MALIPKLKQSRSERYKVRMKKGQDPGPKPTGNQARKFPKRITRVPSGDLDKEKRISKGMKKRKDRAIAARNTAY